MLRMEKEELSSMYRSAVVVAGCGCRIMFALCVVLVCTKENLVVFLGCTGPPDPTDARIKRAS